MERMARAPLLLGASLWFLLLLLTSPPPPQLPVTVHAQRLSPCGRSCATTKDCDGDLVCINKWCNDDPVGRSRICSGDCRPFGTVFCELKDNPRYNCSPPVTSSTPAVLTHNNFEAGGSGEAACYDRFFNNSERVVSLSTGWFDDHRRCGKLIHITASNGRSTTAKVVDHCDSANGCTADDQTAPCIYNALDASDGVWEALGLAIDEAGVGVIWAMAAPMTVSIRVYALS